MRQDVYDFTFGLNGTVPRTTISAPGVSDAIRCDSLREKAVQVCEAFTGSYDIEGSLDGGTTWAKLVTGVTTNAIKAVPESVPLLRLNFTALTAGSPKGKLCGFDARTE